MTIYNDSPTLSKKVDNLTFRNLERHELQKLAQLRWDFEKEEADNEDIKLNLSKQNFIENCLKILQQAHNLKQYTHFGTFNEHKPMIAMVWLSEPSQSFYERQHFTKMNQPWVWMCKDQTQE